MLRVEFHCHTRFSKDSLLSPRDLLIAGRKKGIDRIVITDHNSIAGAIEAQQMDSEHVIVGEEIMTTKGELLGYFVTEEIQPGLTPMQTIAILREQSAFVSVSHPFDVYRSGHWEENDLLEIIPFVDAIETFNARCMQRRCNNQAQAFAQRYKIPGTTGSDAHTAFELGKAVMLLPDFADARELKIALADGKPDVSLSSPLVHLSSRYATWMKKLKF